MFDNGNRPIYTVNQAARIAEDAAEKVLKRFMALNSTPKEAAPYLENETAENDHHLPPGPLTLTVKDMADLLRISMPKAYELTRMPGFPIIRIGRKVLVNRDMLMDWMARQAAPRGE